MQHCPTCGGDLKTIAAILETPVIERILEHLGLPARAPPRSPARAPMSHMPFVMQVFFFGALMSALKSTASATLLAPSVTFVENIWRQFFPRDSDKQELWRDGVRGRPH